MKILIITLLASLFFAGVFLNGAFRNLNQPLADDADLFFCYFVVGHDLDKLSKFDFEHLFDTRMFFPRQNTLAYNNTMLGEALLALPFYLITKNPILSSNIMLLVTLFLSFLAMLTLAYHLTKSLAASIIAGLIFTYNPYVMSHFPANFELITIQWIPLIFLLTEKMIEKITYKKSLVLSMLFLLQLVSSSYYFMYLLIIWPLYVVIRTHLGKVKIKNLLHPAILTSFLLFSISAYIYIQPYIKVKKDFGLSRSLEYNIYHSAQPIDFITKVNFGEHTLFLGFTVYFLMLISLLLLFKKKFGSTDRLLVGTWLVLFVVSLIFSFGPYLEFGNFKIPMPYLVLYKLIPFFDAMRVPARFMVIANLSAAILSAFVIKSTRLKVMIMMIIATVIIFEYWPKPNLPYLIKPEVLKFYSWLDRQPQFKVLLELPIANQFAENPRIGRSFPEESRYLLYGLYHHKYMVNGGSSFIPPDAYHLGNSLTVNFPTTEKLEQLKKMKVDMIVVHRDEFKDQDFAKEVIESLERFNINRVYNSEDIIAFSLK